MLGFVVQGLGLRVVYATTIFVETRRNITGNYSGF